MNKENKTILSSHHFFFQNFGCDGHMDSGKNFDQCAVCDGAGNTCTKVSGTFKSGGKERGIDYTVLQSK